MCWHTASKLQGLRHRLFPVGKLETAEVRPRLFPQENTMGGRQANQDGKQADGGKREAGPPVDPGKTGAKPPKDQSKREQPRQ
jgi:hypothetical protein